METHKFPYITTGATSTFVNRLVSEPLSEIDVLIKRLESAEARIQRLQFFTSDMNVNLEDMTRRVIALEQTLQGRMVEG